jgi:uncharacterized protein with PIN domain
MKFIVDTNVGKLARWLRLLGYDARFYDGADDSELISIAVKEDRFVLTRDTRVMEWGIVSRGRVKALLIQDDGVEAQIRQVITQLHLDHSLDSDSSVKPFTVCLECNERLSPVDKADVEHRVPPYVFQTQVQFVECPRCHRVYWRGTHWREMLKKLENLSS